MTISGLAHDAAQRILEKVEGPIQVGMVLGSGLGALADEVEGAQRFPYHDLPVSQSRQFLRTRQNWWSAH